MTAGTACGARQVPGPRGSGSAASLSLRDLGPRGLGRDAHPSSLRGKAPSGAPGTEWRGCVCPPWDVGLPPFQGFGAGEELGCRERPRCGSGVTRSGVGLAWLQREMGPQPRQTKLVAPPATLALPSPLFPLSLGAHGAGTEPSLPPAAAPLRCSHQTQHVSKSFQFLMTTSVFVLSVAWACRSFGRRRCLAPPGSVLAPWCSR